MKARFENVSVGLIVKDLCGIKEYVPMFHTHVEIFCVLNGEAKLVVDGELRTLSAGEGCVVFPYCVHSYFATPNARAALIMFDAELINDFSYTFLAHKPKSAFFTAGDNVRQFLLPQVLAHANAGDGVELGLLKGYLAALVGEILREMPLLETDHTQSSTIQKLLTYCSQNFTHNIDLRQVSKELFISERQLTNIFSSRLHCSFRGYINLLRVDKAAKLLKKTDKRIIDIMYDCGFENQSSFNRVFRGIKGVTPSVYRKRAKARQSV